MIETVTLPARAGLTDYFRNHPHRQGIVVCQEKKFIYMKAPKTAGSSILRRGLEPNLQGLIHEKDQPEAFMQWLNSMDDDQLGDYFIFAVVRNPYDRFVSNAAYFDVAFKKLLYDTEALWAKDEKLRIHCNPLYTYTHFNGVPYVDMILDIENLQADMNVVFDRIGVAPVEIPVSNTSKHGHYSRYFNDADVARLKALYPDDTQAYGYTFERQEAYVEAKQVGMFSKLLGGGAKFSE